MRRARQSRRDGERGFSLLELLVVLIILSLMTAILVPMATQRIRQARLRTAVNQFALDLRAARWTAVAGGAAVEMTVADFDDSDANSYEYVDVHGRTHRVPMPPGVRIASSSSPIHFKSNGSVAGGAVTVIESEIHDREISRWTIQTNVLGVPSVDLVKVPI